MRQKAAQLLRLDAAAVLEHVKEHFDLFTSQKTQRDLGRMVFTLRPTRPWPFKIFCQYSRGQRVDS